MDWALISSLATAGGTLVLGIATFAVRASHVIGSRQQFWINVLYGDFEGASGRSACSQCHRCANRNGW